MPITALLLRALGTGVAWLVGLILYRLTLHPLAKYPGPFWAKITGFYSVYHAFIGDLHLDMLRQHEKHGKFVRYGPNKLICDTPQAIKDLYSRSANVQKATAYIAFETSDTAHDLQSTVDKADHTRKRRVMGQAFSDNALRSLEDHVIKHVRKFVEYLPKDVEGVSEEGAPVSKNISKWVNYLSFDLMAELVFGRAFDMLEKEDNRYIIDLIQFAAFRVGVTLQMPSLKEWNVDKITHPEVRRQRDGYVAFSKQLAFERSQMKGDRQDLFSHMLNARDPATGKGFSADELWGESTLLIVAGSDAISTGMAGAFYYLTRYPECYKKARDEVRSVFNSPDEIKMGNQLNSCVYLKACIEESLRMSPPVGGALWRETCKGGVKLDGELIPKGLDVGVPIYAIQHKPEFFPSPYEYKPERWIVSETNPEEKVAVARAAMTPFSIGPVGCLGKNLAYMELNLTMAHTMWEIDFAADNSVNPPQPSYLAPYPEHAEKEYWLRDRFTSWKDGPQVSFSRRTDIPIAA